MRNERSFFVLSGNCVLMKQKTFRVDRTAAETKMLLTQPAAGGESYKQDSFLVKLDSRKNICYNKTRLKTPHRRQEELE